MSSGVKLNGSELLEVDICDGGVFSGDEGSTFASSADSFHDFSGFQRWTSPSDTPSPPGQLDKDPPGIVTAAGDSDCESQGDGAQVPGTSIVDCLLVELYETCGRRNVDSWDSSTEASGSDAFLSRCNTGSSFLLELQEKHTRRHQVNYLSQKGEGCV